MKRINCITVIRFTSDTEDVQAKKNHVIKKRIGALVKAQEYFVRVDSYNENGITKGQVVRL